MSINSKNLACYCEGCQANLKENGISQLWDVNWEWNEEEKRFNFSHAVPSERKEHAFVCNECGDEFEWFESDSFTIEPITFEGSGKYDSDSALSESEDDLNCEACGSDLKESGFFQLHDVFWTFNEATQTFEFNREEASELDDYTFCCNQCGEEIDDYHKEYVQARIVKA